MTTTQQTSEQPAELPVARIVTTKEREKFVPLEYPVEFDGKLYEEIRIRRISGKELEDFFKAMDEGRGNMPPVVDCPVEVWDQMDADDQKTVDEAAVDFFPQRLKALRAAVMAASIRAATENTSDLLQPPLTPPSTPSSNGNG